MSFQARSYNLFSPAPGASSPPYIAHPATLILLYLLHAVCDPQWHKRVKLFENNPTKQILTYTEAVKVRNPLTLFCCMVAATPAWPAAPCFAVALCQCCVLMFA